MAAASPIGQAATAHHLEDLPQPTPMVPHLRTAADHAHLLDTLGMLAISATLELIPRHKIGIEIGTEIETETASGTGSGTEKGTVIESERGKEKGKESARETETGISESVAGLLSRAGTVLAHEHHHVGMKESIHTRSTIGGDALDLLLLDPLGSTLERKAPDGNQVQPRGVRHLLPCTRADTSPCQPTNV